MSNAMYDKMWHQTQEALSSLLDHESEVIDPHTNQVFIFQTLATYYIKYVQIFRNLEHVYDQIVHPQKRLLIRKVLDGVMGRILELKNEMVELELSEFHYFDDILQDLKLEPQQLDIPIPKYFMKEKMEAIKAREKMLAQILAESGLMTPDLALSAKTIPLEKAVKLVQLAERMRQGRLRAMFMKQIFLQEYRARQAKLLGEKTVDLGAAALLIQKIWRGFNQSKKTIQEREEEMIFLGMMPPPLFNKVSPTVEQAEKVRSQRDETQGRHEADYQNALVSIKDDLKLVEGPDIKENLQDQIRHWFIECRNLTGTFPDYPDAEEGGSAVIFSNKTPQQVIDDIIASQEEDEKKKKQKKKEKEKKPKKTRKEEKNDLREKSKEEDAGWKMAPSGFLSSIQEGNTLYKDKWKDKDESGNFLQGYDAEMIKEEKRREIEAEIRVQVDELMRQELKNLRLAVNKEKEIPPRGGKRKGGKAQKKGKKHRKGKAGKGDLTADRPLESLYREVVAEGLLIQSLKVNLSDYIGEYCYLGTALRQVAIEPMPSVLDVRQLITLYGVLPLGSASVHEKAPLVRSLLLVGPSGVGKKMLVHAICTETGANLFNLSATNIAGKYPGKAGLQMMLHLVFKVAREFQPSVVWIGDTEKTFYKKVPQAEKTIDPKRLKKQLPKVLKLLKPDDRILIVGTTQRPFDADLQAFCKVYEKIILVPRPDYASRYVLWKEIIQRHGGVLTGALNISCLAKVTDGFTQGHIVQVVKAALTDRRVRQQERKPLTANEFIAAMTSMVPVYQEEEESFKVWYAKTPLGRKRALALMGSSPEKEKEKEKEKKGAKEKKKKKKKNSTDVEKPGPSGFCGPGAPSRGDALCRDSPATRVLPLDEAPPRERGPGLRETLPNLRESPDSQWPR
ncbi:dynein regulatory complex protein 11 [Sorex fumeus]|uniref:dynein regulatory complex protein 11 n=1 Tax=Sorex fumeus TaxID=62283 RepID=UPI0024ADF3EB|nr:dynein regulatory complex protein 11 [Sorex fumeus]